MDPPFLFSNQLQPDGLLSESAVRRIQVIQLQPLHGTLKCPFRPIITVALDPELRSNEKVLPVDRACSNSSANGLSVLI